MIIAFLFIQSRANFHSLCKFHLSEILSEELLKVLMVLTACVLKTNLSHVATDPLWVFALEYLRTVNGSQVNGAELASHERVSEP